MGCVIVYNTSFINTESSLGVFVYCFTNVKIGVLF